MTLQEKNKIIFEAFNQPLSRKRMKRFKKLSNKIIDIGKTKIK